MANFSVLVRNLRPSSLISCISDTGTTCSTGPLSSVWSLAFDAPNPWGFELRAVCSFCPRLRISIPASFSVPSWAYQIGRCSGCRCISMSVPDSATRSPILQTTSCMNSCAPNPLIEKNIGSDEYEQSYLKNSRENIVSSRTWSRRKSRLTVDACSHESRFVDAQHSPLGRQRNSGLYSLLLKHPDT
jgi:hypothetical protein